VTGIVLGALGSAGAIGAGQWLLTKHMRTEPTAWAHALGGGLLIWGFIGLAAGSMGLLTPVFCQAVLLVSLLGLAGRRVHIPLRMAVILLFAAALIGVGLIDVVGPINGADERYLHLGLPQQILLEEGLVGGILHPNGSRPLTLQLAYTFLLSTGYSSAAAGMHWCIAVATLALVIQLGRDHFERTRVGVLAAAVLTTSTTFLTSTGQAASDIPAAFALLLAIDAAVRGRSREGALAGALALSIKYTAAAPLVGIWLFARSGIATRIKVAIAVTLLIAPWWARNALQGLHPLFPFTGWPEPELSFQYIQKYGAGRGAIDFLWLPWRMVFEASPSTTRFLGRIHPYLILLLIPFPLVWRSSRFRPWLAACAAGLIAWAMGPQWLRYLIPALPILALTGAALAVPLVGGRAGTALLWVGLSIGAMSGLQGSSNHFKKATEALPRAGTVAAEFCNQALPTDARVAMLFSWESSDIHRAQILGSLDDHVPTRHFLLAHAGRELEALRRAGATHALVRNVPFLPASYPFLGQETFSQEYKAPVSALNHALLMGADLLLQTPTHRVYRLSSDP
jgi:hypothetical protein